MSSSENTEDEENGVARQQFSDCTPSSIGNDSSILEEADDASEERSSWNISSHWGSLLFATPWICTMAPVRCVKPSRRKTGTGNDYGVYEEVYEVHHGESKVRSLVTATNDEQKKKKPNKPKTEAQTHAAIRKKHMKRSTRVLLAIAESKSLEMTENDEEAQDDEMQQWDSKFLQDQITPFPRKNSQKKNKNKNKTKKHCRPLRPSALNEITTTKLVNKVNEPKHRKIDSNELDLYALTQEVMKNVVFTDSLDDSASAFGNDNALNPPVVPTTTPKPVPPPPSVAVKPNSTTSTYLNTIVVASSTSSSVLAEEDSVQTERINNCATNVVMLPSASEEGSTADKPIVIDADSKINIVSEDDSDELSTKLELVKQVSVAREEDGPTIVETTEKASEDTSFKCNEFPVVEREDDVVDENAPVGEKPSLKEALALVTEKNRIIAEETSANEKTTTEKEQDHVVEDPEVIKIEESPIQQTITGLRIKVEPNRLNKFLQVLREEKKREEERLLAQMRTISGVGQP